MDISVIIPALNEAESIGYVLTAIPKDAVKEVIVVDGGSTDGTVSIAQELGAQVIHEPRPGYGRACASGVQHAGGDVLVFLDGDGADDPGHILELVSPIRDGAADLVLGSRLAGDIAPGAMLWHQRFGNRLSAWLIRLIYKLPVTDLCPFRAIRQDRLQELDMRHMTYGWPTEMLVKAATQRWRIKEIPVKYKPRMGGKSKISGTFRGTFYATVQILAIILGFSRN